jgi:hypothetical protein
MGIKDVRRELHLLLQSSVNGRFQVSDEPPAICGHFRGSNAARRARRIAAKIVAVQLNNTRTQWRRVGGNECD